MARFKVAVNRSSMAVTLTSIIILIFVALQGPLWLWFLYMQKDSYSEMVHARALSSARMVASISARHITSGDTDALMDVVERSTLEGGLLSVRITDLDGILLASANKGLEEREDPVLPLYVPWKSTIRVSLIEHGERLGQVEAVYSAEDVNSAMSWLIFIPPIGQTAVFGVLIASIFGFVYYKVGKPIGLLRSRMEEITSGDLTVEMPELDDRELSIISDGLGFLVQRLSSTVKRMDSLASDVMDTIGSLSSSFDNSIAMVRKQSTSTDEIALGAANSLESQKRIGESTEHLSNIANENVSALMEVRASEDEIVNQMEGLHGATEKSFAIASEMVRVSGRMDEKVLSMQSSVENTAASVEEIIASVREVENSASESSKIADNVREKAAKHGVVTVEQAVQSMDEITARITFSVEVGDRLSRRSSDIQSILSVMKEVTDQTNLLSINASILAEQAGEYGKGFSVVAQEMRELSEKAEGHTKDIAGIVRTIRDEINEVVSAITVGMKHVTEGSVIVNNVGETMRSILDSALESASMTKMKERSTEAQVTAHRHVEESVRDVNSMAVQMGDEMKIMLTSARNIQDHVADVKDIADSTKNGVEEQVKGVKAITRNMETTRERVADINESATRQRDLQERVATEVEEIRTSGAWIVSDMDRVSNTLARLREDIEVLRREMASFKVK